MKRVLFLVFLLSTATPALGQTPAPTSSLDGEWRGKSDGGSCNAPLDFVITIGDCNVCHQASPGTAFIITVSLLPGLRCHRILGPVARHR